MSVVTTSFEQWLESTQHWLIRLGVSQAEVLDLDVAFYHTMYLKGLSPEDAAREDACLSV